jgi:hypothetical protein
MTWGLSGLACGWTGAAGTVLDDGGMIERRTTGSMRTGDRALWQWIILGHRCAIRDVRCGGGSWMQLPELADSGDLPLGVHRASLREVLDRFALGHAQRIAVRERLERV